MYTIRPLKNYRDDGNHLECVVDLPFHIVKGVDPFTYYDKNNKLRTYNGGKDTTKKWIITLNSLGMESQYLRENFHEKEALDPLTLVKYAIRVYKKYLKEESVRVKLLEAKL